MRTSRYQFGPCYASRGAAPSGAVRQTRAARGVSSRFLTSVGLADSPVAGRMFGFVSNLAVQRVSDLPHVAQAGTAGNRPVMRIAHIAGPSPLPRAAATVAP